MLLYRERSPAGLHYAYTREQHMTVTLGVDKPERTDPILLCVSPSFHNDHHYHRSKASDDSCIIRFNLPLRGIGYRRSHVTIAVSLCLSLLSPSAIPRLLSLSVSPVSHQTTPTPIALYSFYHLHCSIDIK